MGTGGHRIAKIKSMPLPYILQELDAELHRLHRLREIIASLELPLRLQAFSPVAAAPQSASVTNRNAPLPAPEAAPFVASPSPDAEAGVTADSIPQLQVQAAAVPGSREPAPSLEPKSSAREPRARRAHKPLKPQAVQAAPPALPKMVVVSAEQLQRERSQRGTARGGNGATASAPATPPDAAPDSLARTLAARWLGGAGTAANAS